MKAKIVCRIDSMSRDNAGFVTLNLFSTTGRVENKPVSAQEAELVGTLKLKAVVANKIRIGELIEVDITTPEE